MHVRADPTFVLNLPKLTTECLFLSCLYYTLSGGLGDSCEGPGGPDDSLCAGNLGCQAVGAAGKAVCGGEGADCSFYGSYKPSTKPNHHACLSGAFKRAVASVCRLTERCIIGTGFCDPRSLTCSTRVLDSPQGPKAQQLVQLPPRQQQRFDLAPGNEGPARRRRVALPAGATCPQGFSVCSVARRRGDEEKQYLACFDTTSSVTQCGGCSTGGEGWPGQEPTGTDCTTLPGVANGGSAACIEARCRICKSILPGPALRAKLTPPVALQFRAHLDTSFNRRKVHASSSDIGSRRDSGRVVRLPLCPGGSAGRRGRYAYVHVCRHRNAFSLYLLSAGETRLESYARAECPRCA